MLTPSSPSWSWRLRYGSKDAADSSTTAELIKSSSCPLGDDVRRLKPLRVATDNVDALGEDAAPATRTFFVYAPPRLCASPFFPEADGRTRVILALHGFGGRPRQEINKWREAAARLRAVVVAPEGTPTESSGKLGWNAIDCCGDPVARGTDDVDFILTGAMGSFLDALRGGGGRPPHVIATGFSNGGFMASLVGLLPGGGRPPWLVGIVPTGGYQYDVDMYGPAPAEGGPRPLPVMSHHGGRDSVVRPGGCCASSSAEEKSGSGCPLDIGANREECTSVRDAFEMWSHINGCASIQQAEGAADDHNRRAAKGVEGADKENSPSTCWRGSGCICPTSFCLWHEEGHAWGFQFPGAGMAQDWMEEVFRLVEKRGEVSTTTSAMDGILGGWGVPRDPHRARTGRLVFSSMASLVLFAALYLWGRVLRLVGGGGRKRKTSEDDISGGGGGDAGRMIVELLVAPEAS